MRTVGISVSWQRVANLLYLRPPGGAVVLGLDEQTLALDRTQPLLPIESDVTEKRIHDYVRHAVTHRLAAINVAIGKMIGECTPTLGNANLLTFPQKIVKAHAGRQIHIVLGNLSTSTTPQVKAWLDKDPHVHVHFTPVGSNRID